MVLRPITLKKTEAGFWLVKLKRFTTVSLKKMDPETKQFIENVDSWIKQIRCEFSQITDVSNIVEENTNNIQHNYELIYELKDEVERLTEEVKALKLMQIMQMKEKIIRKN